jgi:hypothetical protein
VREFAVFMNQAATNSGINHAALAIVDGALTGAKPCVWTVASGPGLTEKQVQATWIEEYNGGRVIAGDGSQ